MNTILKSIANIFIPHTRIYRSRLIGGIKCIEQLYYRRVPFQVKQLVAVLNVIKDGMLAYLAIFTGFNAKSIWCNTRFRWCHWGYDFINRYY